MDTELLRTFLEVRKTRHFARAATNLYITQAAVSARIHQLEELVGQRLFTRQRNNIQLTVAGHKLVPYAESMLATWSRALLDTAFREENGSLMAIGCLPSLREIYLDDWLLGRLTPTDGWLLQLESLSTTEVVARLRDSAIGIGLLYEPPRAPDLFAEPLVSFQLLLVSSDPTTTLQRPLPRYIEVDWGYSVAGSLHSALAGVAVVQAKLDSPGLTRRLLLAHGGSAYLAEPLISRELDASALYPVADAPRFTRTVYLTGRRDSRDDPGLDRVIRSLKDYVGSPAATAADTGAR